MAASRRAQNRVILMSLALSTLLYEWRRYMAAMVALACAGVLILSLSGLFVGLIGAYTATIDRSRADIMVLPPQAKTLNNSGGIPERILPLVYLHPEVVEARDLDGDWGQFFGPGKKEPTQVQVSVIDPIPNAVTLPTDFNETVRLALATPFNIVVDRTALRQLGVKKGDTAVFNSRTVRVAEVIEGYPNFDIPGIIMSRQTLRAMGRASSGRLGPIMVRIKDPARAEQVRDDLNALGKDQYKAWTRSQLARATLDAFMRDGLISIMLGFSVVLGLFIGVIITFQTLQGAILANIKEFASLRALGVSMGSLRLVVMELSFWVGIAGLGLTAGLTFLIKLAANAAGVPLTFQPQWIIGAGILLMIISLISGVFSLGVLKKSQPADLLR